MLSSFNMGPLTIHFYGIVIMLGVVAATYLARREASRKIKSAIGIRGLTVSR